MKNRSSSRKKRRLPQIKIMVQDGRFQVVGMGMWYSYWRDPYHLVLTIPWIGFLLLIAFTYLGTNTLFALAYVAGGDCIANAQPGSFLDAFFFSVQTLASIGYGAMYPKTVYSNAIVTIEAMFGLVGISVLTGLAFARFSKPTARVVFSKVAVITPHEGLPTLIFRTANKRRNQILEAQMRVYLMRDEVTSEGQRIRRIHDLKLLRGQTPGFNLSWTVMHTIDESSPLYGFDADTLTQMSSSIVISLSGIDETVTQIVHARHTYASQDLVWNHRFVDIIHFTNEGHRYIDYNHFHETISLDAAELS
ncbi:MAG: ATP-sensitive inward rectifier potassium channel 10 [Leptolyngbyaceae cyanobacterium CSU_1_3]|nr:ATP-sensitive inward rectifier potassium channel 10 [Leptolyngbyaceae cyanobacterium CSU_1_3]